MSAAFKTWSCRKCAFESPRWNTAAAFRLCTECDRDARLARLPVVEMVAPSMRKGAAIRGSVQRHTEKALLLRLEQGRSVWLPRSGVEGGTDLKTGFTGEFRVAKWLRDAQGL